MRLMEKETGRYVDWKIFDSDAQSWSKGDSRFSREILYKSKIIIVIETTKGKKFGCYIDNQIMEINKYISDSNAFIFKLENGSIEKYPPKDINNVIKILDEKSEDLFIIGKNDIVIKKKDKKERCNCSQKSFDYHGKENALIGKKGNFEVKSVMVVGTLS